MKLFYSPASPFVRKVAVTIEEAGLQDQVERIETATTAVASDPVLKQANPLGKLPTLVMDSGKAIYDSRVITRYLDDLSGAGLYPADRLWDVLTLEATADGIMEAAVLMVYEHRLRPEDMVFADWVEAQWGKVTAGLKEVNDSWMSDLEGPVDAAQIAVGAALGYLEFRHGDRDWRASCPALAAWYDAFKTRPSMATTAPA